MEVFAFKVSSLRGFFFIKCYDNWYIAASV
jgi:hypothetical protein